MALHGQDRLTPGSPSAPRNQTAAFDDPDGSTTGMRGCSPLSGILQGVGVAHCAHKRAGVERALGNHYQNHRQTTVPTGIAPVHVCVPRAAGAEAHPEHRIAVRCRKVKGSRNGILPAKPVCRRRKTHATPPHAGSFGPQSGNRHHRNGCTEGPHAVHSGTVKPAVL